MFRKVTVTLCGILIAALLIAAPFLLAQSREQAAKSAPEPAATTATAPREQPLLGDLLPPEIERASAGHLEAVQYLGDHADTRVWAGRSFNGDYTLLLRLPDGTIATGSFNWDNFLRSGARIATISPDGLPHTVYALPGQVHLTAEVAGVIATGSLLFDERTNLPLSAIALSDERDPQALARANIPPLTSLPSSG